jgi:soluble P-type ATPase
MILFHGGKMMITLALPGNKPLYLKHLVLDYNGTLACDGNLIAGVEKKLNQLAELLDVHILTADTFGQCRSSCRGINGRIHVLAAGEGMAEKDKYVRALGPEFVVAMGNGTNDALMLERAALGIAVVGPEGASSKALQKANLVVVNINNGLDLLLKPKRLVATLRK